MIFRVEKEKEEKKVLNKLKHSLRTLPGGVPNADPQRTMLNKYNGSETAEERYEKFKKLLPEKRRKNAVVCLDFFVGASPEAMKNKTKKEQIAYFKDAARWINKKFGDGKGSLFFVSLEFDETTPHMRILLCPKVDGKLNATKLIGGHRDRLVQLQTDFADEVGAKHGLRRGIQGSKASHKSIKKWYAENKNIDARRTKIDKDEEEARKKLVLTNREIIKAKEHYKRLKKHNAIMEWEIEQRKIHNNIGAPER